MRYLVIGLGIYGSNLAKDLTTFGHEVIAADSRANLVDAIKDYVSTVYVADSTDEISLSALPLSNVDAVIVAIGEDFGASIKTVALLKKLGVKRIFARAVDDVHRSILEGLNVARILTPEQRAAFDLTQEMSLGHESAVLHITDDNYVMKFGMPDFFGGIKYSEINFQQIYGLKIITAARPVSKRNLLGITADTLLPLNIDDSEVRVESGDVVVCYGAASAYHKLIKAIN